VKCLKQVKRHPEEKEIDRGICPPSWSGQCAREAEEKILRDDVTMERDREKRERERERKQTNKQKREQVKECACEWRKREGEERAERIFSRFPSQ
jgi:hypothetical protein